MLEGFKQWVHEPTKISADIPTPSEVKIISAVIKHYYPQAEIYMVGGVVRDHLYNLFHGGNLVAKDVDLTTNLSEEQILEALRSSYAQQYNIKVSNKKQDDEKDDDKKRVRTFGVVFVSVDNTPVIEIAPFRRDIGGDGRRPDAVVRGSMYEDAMRRDLTINNLYYDFDKHEIIDLNPNGQGIKDIKEGPVVRPVGEPFDRFNEDKLRILRLMQFFARFNSGDITKFLDEKTLKAIEHFKDLRFWGITPERIVIEFTAGIKKCRDVASYLNNYVKLDLLKNVFPDFKVNIQNINFLNTRNVKVIYAVLLYGNSNISKKLHALKYPSFICDGVQFLADLMAFNPENAYNVIRSKERLLSTTVPPAITANDLQEFINTIQPLVGAEHINRIKHLMSYQLPKGNSEELMRQGLKGAAIGQRQRELALQDYQTSWQTFAKK